jgi:hypothetical protein
VQGVHKDEPYIHTYIHTYRTLTQGVQKDEPYIHTSYIHTYIHTYRTLVQGVQERERGLVAHIELPGSTYGQKPSTRVACSDTCKCQVVGSVSDTSTFEGVSEPEEHWLCGFVRTLNGMASSFATSLVRGHEVCMCLCMYDCMSIYVKSIGCADL